MPLRVSSIICSSSGDQNCIIQHLVSSHSVGGCPVHRICALCWLITKIILRSTVSKTSIFFFFLGGGSILWWHAHSLELSDLYCPCSSKLPLLEMHQHAAITSNYSTFQCVFVANTVLFLIYKENFSVSIKTLHLERPIEYRLYYSRFWFCITRTLNVHIHVQKPWLYSFLPLSINSNTSKEKFPW